MPDVTCVGNLVADVVGRPVDKMPERGKLELVDRIELHSGGCAANTGVTLSKLGIQTSIIGKVGKDGFGDFLVSYFQANGADAGGVARDSEAATSSTMVMVHSDGERSFAHYLGANATLNLEDIDFKRIQSSKILHIAGSLILPGIDGEPTAELLRKARAEGVITSLDTCWDPRGRWLELIGPCLPYVDYLLPSLEEARMLAGGLEEPEDVAQFLIDRGARVVGLKMGDKGSYIRTVDGLSFSIPPLPVKAIDALGAGDAYVAGFLLGLVRDWNLERCAHFASAVGACCVTSLGGTSGILGFDETIAFMNRYADECPNQA